MGDITLGRITSEPNGNSEHSLRCPRCSKDFLSTITKDDDTGMINSATCPACDYQEEPKLFVAAAHQQEVEHMATEYVANELSKMFKGFK